MRTIKLTQGKSVKVSDEDYDYLNQFKWCYDNGYVVRNIQAGNKYQRIFMHKIILERMEITLKKQLKIKDKLDYCRKVLVPPLNLSPGWKEIPLTQGEVAIVDSCDYRYLMQWNWCYSCRGYAVRREYRKMIYMHKVILKRMGYENFEQGDHINRKQVDNRRINLRPATNRENSMNTRSRTGTSEYKGVSWDKVTNKWAAQIMLNGKRKFLGRFIDEDEAAKAYNKAARKYFSEFAYLNKIGE